jgi:hypothetical protein
MKNIQIYSLLNCLGGSSVSKQTEKKEKTKKSEKNRKNPKFFSSLFWNVEELRQKSFLKVWRHYATLFEIYYFLTFIHTIQSHIRSSFTIHRGPSS